VPIEVILDDRRQAENRRQLPPPVERLARGDQTATGFSRTPERIGRVGAACQTFAEPQYPTIQQYLSQRRPGIEAGFLDTPLQSRSGHSCG